MMIFNLKDLDNRKTFINTLLKILMIIIFAISFAGYFMVYGKHNDLIYGIFMGCFIIAALVLIILISFYVSTIKTNIQIEREIELKRLDIELETIKKKE